ncbi:hypothetical protein [Streptomyces cylindrosporus]|uniref:Uncharacterized protein n=1 Tax=Streptomyces cylindrosporus TaxID=2927583 RepID=A0ABS9YCL8_9ACTN|nr:hypothetical protein [Streptomyces cylindrosporus]MCI3274969.1 hypothetical protein [Streptomyces cylindrosporus]
MGSQPVPYDPSQVRSLAAQQAQQTTTSFLSSQLPALKAEWTKDIQAQLVTMGGQFLKVDTSLLKYDEKGLSFAGKQLFPKLSLQYLVHGRSDARKAEAKEERERREEEAARLAREEEKSRVAEFEQNLKHQVDRAKSASRQAQEVAEKAKKDAERADNLLRSANGSARRAADSASRAGANLARLEERVRLLERAL